MRKFTNIIKYLLPVIFIVFYLETTVFIHSHVIDNTVITHSHPYSSPPDEHNHSDAEIMTFAQMSIITFATAFLFAALVAGAISKATIFILKENHNSFTIIPFAQLRAPPAL